MVGSVGSAISLSGIKVNKVRRALWLVETIIFGNESYSVQLIGGSDAGLVNE
jgi:hypothetical protein